MAVIHTYKLRTCKAFEGAVAGGVEVGKAEGGTTSARRKFPGADYRRERGACVTTAAR